MTIQETKEFMDRIKSHYPSFVVDTFTTNEWYSQLKDYKNEDINKRFGEHLRSETYGDYIPKIHFLTKGLKKIGEKGYDKSQIFVRCNTCNRVMSLSNYENHIDRCKDIDYVIFLYEKYFEKKADRQKLFEMDEITFKEKFNLILDHAIKDEKKEEEIVRLKEIKELI